MIKKEKKKETQERKRSHCFIFLPGTFLKKREIDPSFSVHVSFTKILPKNEISI